jgi:rhodanese-related sulfurtransferase
VIGFVTRMVLLVLVAAVCATGHYVLATRAPDQATHFVPPTTQSAVANPEVADKASVSMEEFQRLVLEGRTTIIDARSPEEFAEGHVPGAKNFYVEAVESDVTLITSQFDPMTDIVLYCAGSACEDSGRLFDILTKLLEFPNVRLFRGGMEAWRAAKLPIEKGPSQRGPSSRGPSR